MYFVYMIGNADGKLYVGVSQNPDARLRHHNSDRGSRFTKSSQSFNTVFTEEYATLAKARKREVQIKKWRRDKKEMLMRRYAAGLPTVLQ